MKKNLYSLTLSDDVVREVDALAHRMGTNRSALVNQILAEYVSVPTPERRWNDIFEAIEELMTPTRELVPFFAPGSSTMSLKSSLSYKYRPTVKYEVDLSSGGLAEHRVPHAVGGADLRNDELLPALGANRRQVPRTASRQLHFLRAVRRALRPSARDAARKGADCR